MTERKNLFFTTLLVIALGFIIFFTFFRKKANIVFCKRKIEVISSELKKSAAKGGRQFFAIENEYLIKPLEAEYQKCIKKQKMIK